MLALPKDYTAIHELHVHVSPPPPPLSENFPGMCTFYIVLKCVIIYCCSLAQLVSKHQSVGGMSNFAPPSVATTVLKNVKKGISALSKLGVLYGAEGPQARNRKIVH